jgi:renalase
VMFALQSRWNLPCDGMFINDGDKLSWLARNSSKPGRPADLDCWVLHSKREWASQNLALAGDDVADMLLDELDRVLAVERPHTIFRQAQRWLYAMPMNRLSGQCAWDAENRLGACGDWFEKEHVEGAFLSGMALASRVLNWLHSQSAPPIPARHESEVRQLELF